MALLRVETRLSTFVGVASYSLYLFHPLVLLLLARGVPLVGVGLPLWLTFPVGSALSVVLAAALYRWVEHPAIALGKRWVARAQTT